MAMAQWVNRLRNNIFVNPPSSCSKFVDVYLHNNAVPLLFCSIMLMDLSRTAVSRLSVPRVFFLDSP